MNVLILRGRRVAMGARKGKPRMVPGYRNFETITRITPSAALVLASEYERIKLLTGNAPWVVNVRKWSPQVFNTLWEIGFFEIVGFPRRNEERNSSGPVRTLRMSSGRTADANEINRLVNDLKGLYPVTERSIEDGMIHLYGALIEAVGNVCGHAYPKELPHPERSVGRWWMTGAVDTKNRRTTAVIYDQGISIPVSLPNWSCYTSFSRRFLSAMRFAPDPSDPRMDGEAISVAVEELVSSTGESHRGHGLAQMSRFVDLCRDGYLRIMSRNGEVIFRPGLNPTVRNSFRIHRRNSHRVERVALVAGAQHEFASHL